MKIPVVKAAVGLGANLGDRRQHLCLAAAALRAMDRCDGFHFSAVYETPAVNCREDLPFLNAAVCFTTQLQPTALLNALQAIEASLGRRRPYPNAPRSLDLDLLLFGEITCQLPQLTVPHPRMAQRLFVLEPLVEIWPTAWHPTRGCRVADLLQERRNTRGEWGQPLRTLDDIAL